MSTIDVRAFGESSTSGSLAHSDSCPRDLFVQALPVLSTAKGLEPLRAQIRMGAPAVIDDLSAAWPALRRWTPERLSARYGHKRVRVYDASFGQPGENYMGSVDSMPFGQYLRKVLEQEHDLRMFLYNIGQQIPELLDDIEFPDVGLPFSRRFVFTFFGCRGSTTPLHYDIDMGYVLHTVIRGRRRVRLFAPDQSKRLYQHPFTVRSYVNLDRPDLGTHPALAQARGWEVTLEAGQTLFMPAGYWHEFHYLEAGMGLSLRAASPQWRDRALGVANLLVLSPVDRLANRIAAARWYGWKQQRATDRASALIER